MNWQGINKDACIYLYKCKYTIIYYYNVKIIFAYNHENCPLQGLFSHCGKEFPVPSRE